jgi:hypothetical protein
MSLEDVLTKREELIRRQGSIQAQLSNLKLGGSRRLSKKELADRELLAAEFQTVSSDITILNKLKREASVGRREASNGEYISTTAIEVATDLKEATKLVTGYLGDVHNVLISWRNVPPENVATCISELAEALGEFGNE